ncbi:hypothetical protein BH23ACT11_BH23ACT11_20450 [soil metagenome]
MVDRALVDSQAMKNVRQSVGALGLGILLALGIAVLVVFGIFWPIAMRFLDPALASDTFYPSLFLVIASAFAFYWGGMISSYRAPGRRKLHGTLVAPATFAISPVVNVLSGKGLFPGLESSRAMLFMFVILLIASASAYIGARRGVALQAHNRKHIQTRRRRREQNQDVASEPERRG